MSWARIWVSRSIFRLVGVCLAWVVLLAAGPAGAGQKFLVLCYHDITPRPTETDDVTPKEFASQLEFFRSHGYVFVTPKDILEASRGQATLPAKAVLLTFDDAYESFYRVVFPTLRMLNIPAVLSVVASWIDNPKEQIYKTKTLMTWEQLQEVADSGVVTIASHSYALHYQAPANPAGNVEPAAITFIYGRYGPGYETEEHFRGRVRDDLARSQEVLAARVGRKPWVMTWPYGAYNGIILEEARKLGFQMALTLEEGFADLRDIFRVNRYYVQPMPYWVPTFKEQLKKDLKNEPPVRAAQVDLDLIVNPASYEESNDNLGRLIDRLVKLGVNTVFLQGFCDQEGTGAIRSVYFPTRVLPVEMDFLSHAVNRIRVRGIKVFVWMPALSFQLPDPGRQERLSVREYKQGQVRPSTSFYPRLSPFAPETLEISRALFRDLAAYVNCDGILFQDDLYLTDEEDMHPAALERFRVRTGMAAVPKELAGGAHREAWTDLKIQALDDVTAELIKVVRVYRPEARFARNIYTQVITDPRAREWFGQDFDRYLDRYRYTVIMAYTAMEKVSGWGEPRNWLEGLVRTAQARNAVDRVVFKVQSYDWKRRRWLDDAGLRRELTWLLAAGARHVAYYPDNVFEDQPPAQALAPVISGREDVSRLTVAPQP